MKISKADEIRILSDALATIVCSLDSEKDVFYIHLFNLVSWHLDQYILAVKE